MEDQRPGPRFVKSQGTTPTERLLARLCDSTFLNLWSYPNPFKNDKKELCDLLAVFDNQVFIFFDRENRQFDNADVDPAIKWSRWKRDVIDSQIRTARGAERYLRSGRKVYLDKELQTEFPLPFDHKTATFHKVIVAHGAKDACKSASDENVYGSLAISYGRNADEIGEFLFSVSLDKSDPIHILDSHNLEIVLRELDTLHDLGTYFREKQRAIAKFDQLSYCGEEDLLAHYFLNFDKAEHKHIIGPNDGVDYNFVMIGEGEWKDFSSSEAYANRKKANEISALWDDLIQRTCKHFLNRTGGGNANLLGGKSAVYEMAKEPRLSRRALSECMITAIRNFPESIGEFATNLSFMPSFYPETGYVFLQLKTPTEFREPYDEYREKRRWLLEVACGVAKNRFSHLKKVVGIAIEAPKFSRRISEDFILLECAKWRDEDRRYYDEANIELNFFSSKMKPQFRNIKEFPSE